MKRTTLLVFATFIMSGFGLFNRPMDKLPDTTTAIALHHQDFEQPLQLLETYIQAICEQKPFVSSVRPMYAAASYEALVSTYHNDVEFETIQLAQIQQQATVTYVTLSYMHKQHRTLRYLHFAITADALIDSSTFQLM